MRKSYRVKKSQDIREICGNDFNILKYIREKEGYSPKEISEELGISLRTIQRIERMDLSEEDVNISLKNLIRYLDCIGLKLVISR